MTTLLAACSTHTCTEYPRWDVWDAQRSRACAAPSFQAQAGGHAGAGADQDHKAQLSPSLKHQPFPHCFTSRGSSTAPGVGSALPLRCPGAGPQLASPVTVPLRHLLAAAFAFPTLQQLLQ